MPSFVPAAQAFQDSLVGLDARTYSGDDAASGAELLARTIKIAEAARAKLGARAAECGAHRDRGFSTPTEWLARQTGESAGQARQELELAAGLENLSDSTRAAVEAGDVSLQETVEIAKTEAECPGSEADMLDEAKRRGLRGVKEKGRKLRQQAQNPDELARKRRRARHLRSWTDELGMTCGQFALEPHLGVPFLERLNAEIDRQYRSGDRDYRAEPREARAADALSKRVSACECEYSAPARRGRTLTHPLVATPTGESKCVSVRPRLPNASLRERGRILTHGLPASTGNRPPTSTDPSASTAAAATTSNATTYEPSSTAASPNSPTSTGAAPTATGRRRRTTSNSGAPNTPTTPTPTSPRSVNEAHPEREKRREMLEKTLSRNRDSTRLEKLEGFFDTFASLIREPERRGSACSRSPGRERD